MNDSYGGGGFRGGSMNGGMGSGLPTVGGGSDFGSAPGSATFGGNPIVQSRNPSPVSGPIMGGSYGMDAGGMVPGGSGPGQGQEGGIPMSGAAQPAAATPGQRLQSAGNLVQSLLMHGMKKHNLMGPDGKPMKVGAYFGGGLVRSFALGGPIDDTSQSESAPPADASGGGNEPETQGAIPSGPGAQDNAVAATGGPGNDSGVGGNGPSVASQGSRTPSVMQYVTGADAPPDATMSQLHEGFKRGGRSGNEAALAAVAAAGEKSPNLGFAVTQGFRKRYDRSRAAAAQAFDMGNMDGGVSHLNEAFNNLPTAENANFSHDGQNVVASLNGKSYPINPKFASELLAKGQHFDQIAFSGVKQPLATISATSAAAGQMFASTGNPRQPSAPRTAAARQQPQGTQVAGNYPGGVNQAGWNAIQLEKQRAHDRPLKSDGGLPQPTAEQRYKQWEQTGTTEAAQQARWNSIEAQLQKEKMDPAEIAERKRVYMGGAPAAPAAEEPKDTRTPFEWLAPNFMGGKSKPTAQSPQAAQPAAQPAQQAAPTQQNAPVQKDDPVPAGYRKEFSPSRKQYRLVPIGP